MRKLFIKILIFALLVMGIQFLLPLPSELAYKTNKMDHFQEWNADIVYFGDSTIKWSPKTDKSNAHMLALLKSLIRGPVVLGVTHQSYQMDIYLYFSEYFNKIKYYPKLVIIPINLRSFSPEWDMQPLWQFEDDRVLFALKDTPWIRFYKPLSVFKLTQPKISRSDYEHTKVYEGDKYVGRVRDFDNPGYAEYSDENLRNKMIFRYMYPLKMNNRKILSMRKLIDIYRANGTKLLFYTTPIDYQTARKYVGPEFVPQVKENVDLIRNVLKEYNLDLLDLSMALDTEKFSWKEDEPSPLYPNEHLKLKGRMIVVANIFKRIQSMF